MKEHIFEETLPKKTAKLVKKLQSKKLKKSFLNTFYLSGGTALSLQLGHRESEDLDFFNINKFDPKLIEESLADLGTMSETKLAAGTVNTYLDGVKLQFLEYPYKLIKPKINWGNISLSSVEDIACTKLQTISMRGSKKDFVDFYFILKKFSIKKLFKMLDQKYSQSNYSKTHIIKSLVYFTDADKQPMPRMHIDVTWIKIKEEIKQVVKKYQFN